MSTQLGVLVSKLSKNLSISLLCCKIIFHIFVMLQNLENEQIRFCLAKG